MSLPQTDADPRLTIRADLVAAGRRGIVRRRRQRGATLAAIAVAGVLGTAGAAAKIDGSGTGVPVLDDVLAISVERNGGPRRPANARTWVDLRPGPGGASAPLTLPPALATGSGSGIGVAYADRNSFICFVRVGAERRAERGGVGCTAHNLIWQRIDETAAFVTSAGGYDRPDVSAVVGFARPDVESVQVIGSRGPVEATLGDPWTPKLPNARTLRPFVAVIPYDPAARPIPDVAGRGLIARLADGRVVELLDR